ncbi:MAG: DegT/DnrJ/EryC1/StrS aminotransferase family protein [Thermodesulfobacteriota bacterium]
MLPYARPSIGEAEIAEVEACLRSGWLSTGPRAMRFEQELAARLGVKHALGASSGTAALHLAVLAAGVRPGDEVVTTPMTWVSTANVLLHAGARPVFVDVEPGTLNLDVTRIEQALTRRTRVILPVHFAGLPCDQEALRQIAERHRLAIVEDAAHALGASYRGREIGTFGDATMFSFHPAKNVTTGEGGALVTDSDDLAARARRLRFHGIDQTPESRFGGRGAAAYDVLEPGFKYNFTDLQAAIGLHQLARLDELNARRRALAALYRERLADAPWVAPLATPSYAHEHAWHLMVVSLEVEALAVGRDDVLAELREAGVGAGLHFVPLHLQTLYRDMADPARLPVATDAHRRILSLPLFPEMRDEDVTMVVETLAKVLRRNARAALVGSGTRAPARTGGAAA